MRAVNRGWALAALGGAVLGAGCLAHAASNVHTPNLKRGAVIAAQGTAKGAPACAQCHAFNGGSDSSGAFPRIAHQSADYLAAQLFDFSSGVRTNALMSQIAHGLDPNDIIDVAAYYASLDAPFLPLKPADPVLIKQGQMLATVGSAERGLQGCNNCHGPGGAGEPPAIPYLAGQYADYITFTLHMWQLGLRKNSPESMQVVAKKLTESEIAAVSAYYQQAQSALEQATATGAQ
jgi:cytochrome c553